MELALQLADTYDAVLEASLWAESRARSGVVARSLPLRNATV